MQLQSLSLADFRSYPALELDLSAGALHLFVGPNGSGKTNILEAVSVLSLSKSCRGRDEAEIVAWEKAHYRVRAACVSDSGEASRLEVVSELSPRRRKACFVNDVRTPLSGMVGKLPTVIFLPQDLLLFSGPPAERRRFLDQLLSQVHPSYLADSAGYGKVLQQRNALLRNIAEGREQASALDPWDLQLAEYGARITAERLGLIETLGLSFGAELRALGEAWDEISLAYARKTRERDVPGIAAELRELLARTRERDLALLSTTAGPHREDWQASVEGRELPTFASRGQERSAVLALLLLEVNYLELRRGEKPVVLLDDAFSELDDRHQASLLSALRGHQVLLTATRVPPGLGDVRVWEVEKGSVRYADAHG